MHGKKIGIIFLRLCCELVLPVYGLSWPRFITPWVLMDANNASTTDQTFNHGFGTVPRKVEVQVKSPVTGFIYPGVGSSHGTNAQGQRGGVLCIFNTDQVRLLGATNDNSIQNTAYIIFTGNLSWTHGHQEISTTGWVRARIWHPDDFPAPDYTDSIGLKSGDDFLLRDNSGSLSHGLGAIPAYTVVQYYHPDIAFVGEPLRHWYAEAQGSNAHKQDDSIFWGALTYAVGPTDIRLWGPSSDSYGLLSFCEGWGSYLTDTCSFTRCTANVYMWSEFPGTTSVQLTKSASATTDTTTKEFNITPGFNANSDLVSVMYEAIDGNNEGYQFAASGAAQLDGIDECGGVVYGYLDTARTVRLWHPTTTVHDGYIVFIYEMGDDWNNQKSTDVILHINVWKVNASVTTTPAATTFSTVTTTTSTLTTTTSSSSTTSSTTSTPIPITTTSTTSTSLTTTPTIPTTLTSTTRSTSTTIHTPTTTTSTASSSSPSSTTSTQPPSVATTQTPYTTNSLIHPPSDTSTAAPGILCFNTTIEVNITVINEKVEEIVANLTVDTRATSKFRRSLVSASDDRQSSMYIGMIGALFSGLVVALIVIPDLLALFRIILSDRINYSDF